MQVSSVQVSLQDFFSKHQRRVKKYRREPCSESSGDLKGYEVIYIAGDDAGTWLKIPLGERCKKKRCIALDCQCVHELMIDKDFILKKWGTEWWSTNNVQAKVGRR